MSRRGEKRSRSRVGETGSDGQKRRSPRLSGSTSVTTHAPIVAATATTSKDKPPPHSIKHSLMLPPSLHSDQGDGAPDHRDHFNADESWLPEKSILELVLDTLQRRDTYDIFAEPVDPFEVEEYYEIIKEPMDFGTMRAKLHEGMYKNLQQFERDIFLIFENAMHFNSSATVYFRQARALEDLAKKIFSVLKTDPEKFKLEFTATRRRSSRRSNVELSDSTIGSCRKLGRDLGSNSMCIDLGQKGCQRQRTFVTGVDRRSTYKPRMSLLDESSSTLSATYYGTKSLIFGNLEDVGYKESLMLYVKDLGPTAHRVAKSKLQGSWTPASSSLGMNCWDSFQSEYQTHPASFPNHSCNGSGTVPATSSASHCFEVEMAYDTRKQSKVNCPENAMPSPAQEAKHTQVGDFDLNQVQVQVTPSSSCSHVAVNCCKDGDSRTPSELLGAREFSRLSLEAPATTTVSSVAVSSQSTLNLVSMNSRLRESLYDVDDGFSTNGQAGVLQVPCDTKLSFWNVCNQKGLYGGQHYRASASASAYI